jgi:hypothetical protein
MSTQRTKAVYFYKAQIESNVPIREVLLDSRFHLPYNLDGKTLELKFPIEENNGMITGNFVMTRTTGIPPKHRVNTDNYDAIQLEDGEGLSYPNAFIYNPHKNVLGLEFNLNGTYPSQIEKFLRQLALNRNSSDQEIDEAFNLNVQLHELLTLDAYERILNFDAFQKVTMKIAYPDQLIQEELRANGPIRLIGELADQLNATSSMEISFSASIDEGVPGLNKERVLELVRTYTRVSQSLFPKRGRNKLIIEGLNTRTDDPEFLDRETIDLMKDRMRDSFELTEPAILTSIQPTERRSGIIESYNRKSREINSIT